MATIIDSLLVTLGLETSSFDSKRAKVDKSLKTTRDEADKTGKQFKKVGKDGAESYAALAKGAAAFLAVIGGASAIKSFIENTISSSAALQLLSQNLNVSANDISAWSNAAELAGGSAEGLQGTMDMLSKSQTELMLTGNSGLIPYFTALGVGLADVNGKARPVNDILLDLADRFGSMDRTTANNMGRMFGIDQGTMQLLLKGRKEVEIMIARQKEYGAVTKKQAEESARLKLLMRENTQTFIAFGRELLAKSTPALETFFNLMSDFGTWCRDHQEFIQTFLTIITVGLIAMGVATLPINLVVLAVLALAAGIAALYDDYQVWKRGGDSLIDWSKWEPGIKAAGKGILWLRDLVSDAFYRMFALFDAGAKALKGDWSGAKFAMSQVIEGNGETYGAAKPTPSAPATPKAAPAKPTPSAPATPKAAPAASGNADAVAYFQSQGWTEAQAIGLAANIQRESAGKANAVGDGGKAYGLAQWHPDRQANFKKLFGKDIQGSTSAEQMAFIHHELTQGTEKKAGDRLKGATSAGDAAAIVSKYYERPGDREGEAEKRSKIATAMSGIRGASQAAKGAGGAKLALSNAAAASGGGNTSSNETNIGEVKIYTAATDAEGIANDMSKSLNNTFASQANLGLN